MSPPEREARGSEPSRGQRRSRIRRIALGVAAVLGSVVLLVGGALWLLLGTEWGTRWLFSRVGGAMAGSIEVDELAGPIRGPLAARGLRYESDGVEVYVERLSLRWRLRELVRRRLDIDSLHAEGVTVRLADGSERAEPIELPDVHLPINIVVREAVVRDVEVLRADTEPLAIDSIELVTTAIGDVVQVERLEVASPELAARASGTLVPQGDYEVDLELEWSARLEGKPRWAGRGTFAGTLETLRVEHELSSPVAARATAVLEKPLRDLVFDAQLSAPAFPLAALGAGGRQDVLVGGRVRAQGRVEELAARGEIVLSSPETGPASIDAAVERDGDRWRIERLLVASRAARTRVTVEGAVTLADGDPPSFDLDATWTDLEWPLAGEPSIVSPKGSGEAVGTLADYQIAAELVLARPVVADLPPAPLEIVARGDERRLLLERARLGVLGGELRARGRVSWDPRPEWDLLVEASDIDPSGAWPDFEGRLGGAARTAGHLDESGAVGRVAPFRVAGTLRSEPIDARGTLAFAGERIEASDLVLDWGEVGLAADGLLQPSLDFTFALEAPNLGLAVPDAAGSLRASGKVEGPREAPHVVFEAAGQGIRWGEISAATIVADADLDLAPRGALALDAAAEELLLANRSFETAAVRAAGTRARHRLTVEAEASGGDGSLRLVADGGLDDGRVWRGRVHTLDVAVPRAGSWSLADAASVVVSRDRVELDRLCARSNEARVCAAATWGGDEGWRASAELDEVPLSLGASFLPPDLDITGAIEGTVRAAADAGGVVVAAAELRPGPGEIHYPLPDGGRDVLRFGRGSLEATAASSGVEAELDLPLPELGSASGSLELPGYLLPGPLPGDQRVAATLRAEITDLGFVQAFTERITDTAGKLAADLRVGGTVGRPLVSGSARLDDGQAMVPELGIVLTDMNLRAVGDPAAASGAAPLRVEGSVRSGDGTVTIGGIAPPFPTEDEPIHLELTGERFLAMDTPEVTVLANPDLALTFDGARLALEGEVVVPDAEVEIEEPPEVAVEPSADVVYVGGVRPAALEDDVGLPLAIRVRVVLGDDVELDVLGLAAEPEGSLLLVSEPGSPTRGTGEIDLAGGTYKAYGQDLEIERGRLIFAGPLDNPQVDLRAFRTAADGVVAGLEASGSLEHPQITLWSEPPMAQAEQLSYLLLGRPLGEASSQDGDLVANAASALGLRYGNLLAERLAVRFGLEEARIESEGGIEQAQLVLGKFLSPRIYVAYGVGLFEAANTVRVRYLLSSKWTLEATTGDGTGADLLYTIERGRGAEREAPRRDATEPPRRVTGGG